MKKSNCLFFLLALKIAGCEDNPGWSKLGASNADFKTDHYTCLQESQENRTIGSLGGDTNKGLNQERSGVAPDKMVTNWNLFNSCMSRLGWKSTM